MTPREIAEASADMPTPEEIEQFAGAMRAVLPELSRRDAVAVLHASINIALEVGHALASDANPRLLLASFLLRECEANAEEAHRAVRQVRAKADAEIARARSKVTS